MIEKGNQQSYNDCYRECMRAGRPFLFVQYSSGTRKYASVHYDFWPTNFDLKKEAADTILELMESSVHKSLNDLRHKKRGSVYHAGGTISGFVYWILTSYAEELALAIERVVLDKTNQIDSELSLEARNRKKRIGRLQRHEVQNNE